MSYLNLIGSPIYMETDLDEIEIRNLIINNKRNLGLTYFDENRTPLSYQIVIDGITELDEQYRVSILIMEKTIYREVELKALGSGQIDKIKAGLFRNKADLYSLSASCFARDLLAALFERAEQAR